LPKRSLHLSRSNAAREIDETEHELDLFVTNPKLLSLLGESRFVEGVEVHQLALDEARRAFAQARSHSSLAEELADGDCSQTGQR
jgi:hypothetical protein